jgi:hypothetical protein
MKTLVRISGLLSFFLILSQFSAAKVEDPFPEFSNWKISKEFPVYTPDNLWDYINGAATVYLQFGFTELRMAEYSKGKKKIMVEIYHHGSRENAFGIYARERYPDYHFMEIGVQGYQQGPVLNFLKGEYYVKMLAGSDKPSVIKSLLELSETVAQQLEGENKFPDILSCFPEENKLINTEKFIAVNFLGHEFFSDVFSAQYKTGEEEFSLFLSKKAGPEECKMVLENYLDFTGQDLAPTEPGTYLVDDRYNGKVTIAWIDNMLLGLFGTQDDEIIDKYLELMKILVGNK